MKSEKTELFETKPIPRAVMELSIPCILGSLVMMLYNMADTYFVGMLNDPVQNAAVTLAGPVMLAFNSVNNLFGVGASSLMSRALGQKDYETVKNASCLSFYASVCLSLLISLIFILFKAPMLSLLGAETETFSATSSYMLWTVALGACPAILNMVMSNLIRAEGFAMTSSLGVMSGCILNIILDPFFILPQFINMGAAGAGFATFISNSLVTLYFLAIILGKRLASNISLDILRLRHFGTVAGEICNVGIPAALQNLLNVTGMTILNNFTAAYGSDAVAAMGIAHKIQMLPMYISMGFTQGIMPLISYNYTSGNHRRLVDCVAFAAKLSCGIALAATALMYFNAEPIVRAFMKNPAVVAYGGSFLRAMSIGIFFINADFFAVAIFQALGKGKYSLIFALMRKIGLEIPAIIILNKLFPLYGMAWAQTCAEFVLAVAAVIVLKKLYSQLNLSRE